MSGTRGRKAVRPDDKRLAANRPPEAQSRAPKSRTQQLLAGELTVEDLDDDEIMQGRCKNSAGGFSGRPPATFPRAIHDGLRKEFNKRMQEKWNSAAQVGFNVMLEIAQNKRASADARFKAAQYLTERSQGKIPDKIEQTVELKPYEENIEALLVDIGDDTNVVPFNKGKRTA